MSSTACPKCQRPLSATAPEGICPVCLVEQMLGPGVGWNDLAAPEHSHPQPESGDRAFGDYELLREIARGGMGVVYQARHRRLNRIVALKMVLSSPLSGEPSARRFRAEAEAAASLEHPNIVPIYEVGEADGRLFYTMKFIEGGTLAAPAQSASSARSTEGAAFFRETAAVMIKLARAVQYAHERGILHRDLKPSNILLDAAGEPAVADFGLARWLEEDSDLTGSGAVLGSPSYMAPEQAAGAARELTTSADVYGLGAVFFFMLTRQAPFAEATAVATIRAVIEREPSGPASLNPGVPRDLDTICRKCLAKEPASRYPSAGALADDLERWQRGEPIFARPAGALELTYKWARRNPAWALLILVLLLTPMVVISLLLAGNARVRQAQTQIRLNLYAADMESAQTALEEADLRMARKILSNYEPRPGQPELRGFEWRYLSHRARSGHLRVLRAHSEPINCLAFSPDGRWLASSEVGRSAWFWSTISWRPERVIDWSGESQIPFRWISFSRNSDFLALTTDPDPPGVPTPEEHSLIFDGQNLDAKFFIRSPYVLRGLVSRMLWSPVADKVAFLAEGGPERRFVGVLDWSAFKANPGRRSTVHSEGVIADKRQDSGSFPEAPILRLPGADALLNFTADGTLLALRDGQVIAFDVEHGGGVSPVRSAHTFDYCELSPNGRFLAGFNHQPKDRHSVLVDEFLGGMTNYWEMIGHQGELRCLAISPDSRFIATGSADHTACIWDSDTRKPVARLRGHSDEVIAVAWSPDGKLIATGSQDRTIMLWSNDPTNQSEGVAEPLTGTFGPWVMAQDGSLLAGTQQTNRGSSATLQLSAEQGRGVAAPNPGLIVCDLPRHEKFELRPFSPNPAETASAGSSTPIFLSAARNELLTVQEKADGSCKLVSWDLVARTNSTLGVLSLPGAQPGASPAIWTMSSNRHWLAGAAEAGTVHIWRMAQPAQVENIIPSNGIPVTQLAFSPDSRELAVVTTHQRKRSTATIWPMDSKTQPGRTFQFETAVNALQWSPNGFILGVGCQDHTIQLWNIGTGKLNATLASHKRAITAVAFSPDGQTLASTDGHTIKLWHMPTAREMLTIYRDVKFGHPVRWLAFASDGTRLLAADEGGRVQIFLAPFPSGGSSETASSR